VCDELMYGKKKKNPDKSIIVACPARRGVSSGIRAKVELDTLSWRLKGI